jgi:hypothetical protein
VPAQALDATAQTDSPTPTGRRVIVKEEITRFLQEQTANPTQGEQSAPVSQDDIDTLFRR